VTPLAAAQLRGLLCFSAALTGANAPDDAWRSPTRRTATRQISFIRGNILYEARFNQYAILNKHSSHHAFGHTLPVLPSLFN
jgi:hypothetical protein